MGTDSYNDIPDMGYQSKFTELGSTGLKRYGGYIYEEIDLKLLRTYGPKTYREMIDTDPIVGALIYSMKVLIRNVKWTVKPNKRGDAAAKKNATFLQEVIDDMHIPWGETITEISSFLEYGFSLHEICYKRRLGAKSDPVKTSMYKDGKIGWSKLAIRSQESCVEGRWFFDEHGEITAVYQLAPPDYAYVIIPRSKFLLFRTTMSKNNPEGRSLLRSAYRPFYMKRNIENIEAIGIERDLAGLPVMYCPAEYLMPSATPEQKQLANELKKIVTNIRVDDQMGLVMPMQYTENGDPRFKLELLSTGGKRSFDTTAIITRYATEIAMSVLGDFVMLGNTGRGTQALAREKANMFMTAIETWLQVIADIFNNDAIPRLFAANGITDDLPKLVPGEVSKYTINDFVNNIRNLAVAGMPLFPNKDLENLIREKMDLPVLQEGEKAMDGSSPMPGLGQAVPKNRPQKSSPNNATSDS